MRKITVFLFSLLLLINCLFVITQKAEATTTTTFSYTGAQQTWVVPADVTSVTVDMKGAGAAVNGKGGRVQGTLTVTPGETLYIYIGGTTAVAAGGFNGGGIGRAGGIGGNGASDIRQGGNAVGNRVAVASGGGGSNGGTSSTGVAYGGGGGGTTGFAGDNGNDGYFTAHGGVSGNGGTPSAGGAGGNGVSTGASGDNGAIFSGGGGGDSTYAIVGGGGGGGGYYGGGGGEAAEGPANDYATGGGGGGGSSYAGSMTSVTHTVNTNNGNGSLTLTYTPQTPTSPAVVVSAETNVNSTSTTLNATVNPNSGTTSAWYLWGRTNVTCSNLPNSTASQLMGSGASPVALTAALTGFVPGVTYYYCAIASNSSGVTYSAVTSFTQGTSSGCTSVSLTSDYTASSSCVFANSTADGVDKGTGTTNNGYLTVAKGTTLTVGSSQVVAFGFIYKPGATIVMLSGGSLRRGSIWVPDTDGDGYPDNPGTQGQIVQATAPSGYARRAVIGTATVDCSPSDAAKFTNYMSFIDADGDGYATTASQQLVCSGGSLTGATQSSSGVDCLDSSANIYRNVSVAIDYSDQDGYSAAPAATACVGASTTVSGRTYYKDGIGNFSYIDAASILGTSDCSTANANIYQNVSVATDVDQDGYSTSTASTQCVGASTTVSGRTYYKDSSGNFTKIAAASIISPCDSDDSNASLTACADVFASPDTVGSVGYYPSTALDSSGFPVISYNDQTNNYLKLLHCGNANCSSGNSITAPDVTVGAGYYPSTALDSSGFPVVSYWETTNQDLKILHCGNANCTSGNSITSPDTTGNVGSHSSLALDSSGFPVVAYYDTTNADLKILHCGNANCSSGNSITSPDTVGNVGGDYNSLALDVSGFPVVAYYDTTNGGLKILHCGNANCTSGNSIVKPAAGANVGAYPSLALAVDGSPIVSYYAAGVLSILHCGDRNCSAGNTIASPATNANYLSLRLDVSGFPVVAYRDYVASYVKVLHCGSQDCSSGNTIISADTTNNGQYTFLILDSAGFPVVAYEDGNNVDLKVLHCGTKNCSAH